MLTGNGDETGSDSGSGSRKTDTSNPLGPLWIGYGSEGFPWSVQFSLELLDDCRVGGVLEFGPEEGHIVIRIINFPFNGKI
jgi:hypothetical protein